MPSDPKPFISILKENFIKCYCWLVYSHIGPLFYNTALTVIFTTISSIRQSYLFDCMLTFYPSIIVKAWEWMITLPLGLSNEDLSTSLFLWNISTVRGCISISLVQLLLLTSKIIVCVVSILFHTNVQLSSLTASSSYISPL